MPPTYSSPPIIEALCEFRFSPDTPWDLTVPGLFYAQVKDSYPQRRQVNALEIAVAPGAAPASRETALHMQFDRADGTATVQVGPHQLVVAQGRPYPGWAAFRAMIAQHLAAYRDVSSPSTLARLGLRYINRIDVPGSPPAVDDYFTAAPRLPEPIPNAAAAFLLVVQTAYPELPGSLRLTFGNAEGAPPGSTGFLIDLDMTAEGALSPRLDDVSVWLNAAHERLEEAFVAVCSERTHTELFGRQPV